MILDDTDLGNPGRSVSAGKAYDAALAAHGAGVTQHTHFLMLFHPGTWVTADGLPAAVNGGATTLPSGQPTALGGSGSSHTFLAHELGHALGFAHSFGLLNDGIHYEPYVLDAAGNIIPDPTPRAVSHEYGDPADIMSAEKFGGRWLDSVNTVWVRASPVFAGAPIDSWPGRTPAASLGPGLSPALLHQAHPDWLPDGSVASAGVLPWEVELQPAYGAQRGHRLAVVSDQETTDGRGRLYLEWRPALDWDQGLATIEDGEEDRAGVIVHELADTPNLGVRPWFRGVVPVPAGDDTDLDVAGTAYRVTVLGTGPGTVRVRVALQDGTWARIDVSAREEVVDGRDVLTRRTPCGATVRWGRWLLRSVITVRAVVAGLGGTGGPGSGQVTLNWTLAGVPLGPGDGRVPVTDLGGTELAFAYPDPASRRDLLLQSRAGESYPVAIRLLASDGYDAVTAETSVAIRGERVGFHPDDHGAVEVCFERIAYERLRLRARDLLIPPDLDPALQRLWRRRLDDRLRRLAVRHPEESAFLREVIAARR